MTKRGLLLLGVLAAAAAAGERDGAHAGIERWAHARGPASNSGRSLAWPPDSFGGIRWTYEAADRIAGAPVTWDGVGYVLDGATLVALDLVDGGVLARVATDSADSDSLCVYDRAAFVVERGENVVRYRLKGRAFKRSWSVAVAGAFPPRILKGEIYVAGRDALVRLRAGADAPVWRVEGRFAGAPAVFGDEVYAVRREADGSLTVAMYARIDGKRIGAEPVAANVKPGGVAHVAASRGIVAVRAPYGTDWTLWRRKLEKGAPTLAKDRTEDLRDLPLVGDSMLLGRTRKPDAWTILRFGKRPRHPLVTRARRPDLMAGAQDCVSLNGTICFGTWAADLGSNRILWHLAERRDVTAFAKGVRFPAVPAGHRVLLLVNADGTKLHLVGQEKF